jgi:cellobiose phosphorylase
MDGLGHGRNGRRRAGRRTVQLPQPDLPVRHARKSGWLPGRAVRHLRRRGGWTWYTGSASWLYRLGLEAILGFRREGQWLRIDPVIPPDWESYQIHYRFGSARYHITVHNPQRVSRGVRQIRLDGQMLENGSIPLADDGRAHKVVVELGE